MKEATAVIGSEPAAATTAAAPAQAPRVDVITANVLAKMLSFGAIARRYLIRTAAVAVVLFMLFLILALGATSQKLQQPRTFQAPQFDKDARWWTRMGQAIHPNNQVIQGQVGVDGNVSTHVQPVKTLHSGWTN